jgi:hypothetical protein
MRTIDATALSGFARKTAESASGFASVVHDLIKDVRDSYRPSLHEVRGSRSEMAHQTSVMAKIRSGPIDAGECTPSRRT